MSSELYNNFLEIYCDEYNELSDAKKESQMIIIILYYSVQSEKKEESTDKEEYVHLHVTTRW